MMAQGPPVCSFSGTVTLDGNPVDAGTKITAKADGTEVGMAEAYIEDSVSKYFMLIPQGDLDEGAALNFYVVIGTNEYLGGTGTWNTGGMPTLNLAASTGVVPEPDISVPTSLNFGNVVVDSSKDKTLTISNEGGAVLTITSIDVTGTQFSVGAFPGTIAASSSADVTVTFEPTSSGTKSATLTVSSNDPDEPEAEVSLSGTGQEEAVPGEGFAYELYETFIECLRD